MSIKHVLSNGPYHLYAPGDPVPQVVIVSNENVWLPEGKYVPVATLAGRLVRLEEVKEEEGTEGVTDAVNA